MGLSDAPIPSEGMLVTHLLIVKDQAKSREFYSGILGGEILRRENPCFIKLANTWIILNAGGGPTPDKPEVVMEPPQSPNLVNSILNIRVADVHACYEEWKAKGVEFLTEPKDNNGLEFRCYMRDPDGNLIEVGQASPKFHAFFEADAAPDG